MKDYWASSKTNSTPPPKARFPQNYKSLPKPTKRPETSHPLTNSKANSAPTRLHASGEDWLFNSKTSRDSKTRKNRKYTTNKLRNRSKPLHKSEQIPPTTTPPTEQKQLMAAKTKQQLLLDRYSPADQSDWTGSMSSRTRTNKFQSIWAVHWKTAILHLLSVTATIDRSWMISHQPNS